MQAGRRRRPKMVSPDGSVEKAKVNILFVLIIILIDLALMNEPNNYS